MSLIDSIVISVNNRLTRLRNKKVSPEDLLLLVPHCIQRYECTWDVKSDIQNCQECGRCQCCELLLLSREFGIPVAMVAGGMEAIRSIRGKQYRAVVAIACARELRSGIISAFPLPVYAIPNEQPHGPCRSTIFPLSQVRSALERFLGQGERKN